MQNELEGEYPELEIQLLGVNLLGNESGVPGYTEGRDLPLLQDQDENGDGVGDALAAWDAKFRDVIVLGANNERLNVYNLSQHSLTLPGNFATLKQMLVDYARDAQCLAGDANRDGIFDSGDLIQVMVAGEYEDDIVGNSTWETGDWNHDGEFDSGDLVRAFVCGKYDNGEEDPVAAHVGAADLLGQQSGDRARDQVRQRLHTVDAIPPDCQPIDLKLQLRDRVFGEWNDLSERRGGNGPRSLEAKLEPLLELALNGRQV